MKVYVQDIMDIVCRNTCSEGHYGVDHQAIHDQFMAWHNANRVQPTEPTDPRARVTDRRENVWRLLADGDWVCTSGPDIGEYLVWEKLAAERGPLEVEVTP